MKKLLIKKAFTKFYNSKLNELLLHTTSDYSKGNMNEYLKKTKKITISQFSRPRHENGKRQTTIQTLCCHTLFLNVITLELSLLKKNILLLFMFIYYHISKYYIKVLLKIHF